MRVTHVIKLGVEPTTFVLAAKNFSQLFNTSYQPIQLLFINLCCKPDFLLKNILHMITLDLHFYILIIKGYVILQ